MSGRFIITPFGLRQFREPLCQFHKTKWKDDIEERICLEYGAACEYCLRNGAHLTRLSGGKRVLRTEIRMGKYVKAPIVDHLKPLSP
jgi:hypothetical protein